MGLDGGPQKAGPEMEDVLPTNNGSPMMTGKMANPFTAVTATATRLRMVALISR